jgi:heptosyltransferase III
MKRPPTYCIFRTDRIGDVVLTLPVAEAIKRHEPDARVLFCARELTRGIVEMCPFVDDVFTIADRDVTDSIAAFTRELKRRDIDVAVFAYPRPGLAAAARFAGIPIRIGTGFRYYSPLFNRRVYEHRREAARHESEYNLRLLHSIGIPSDPVPLPALRIPGEAAERASIILKEIGIPESSRLIVLHPGSGGSAKDWSARNFGSLAVQLAREHAGSRILVTGASKERPLMEEVREASEGIATIAPGGMSLPELTAVLARASLCIANSTGPLHIAAAVGTPVIGLYPFERVCNPRRWGPLSRHAEILTPPAVAGCAGCLSLSCPAHDRMDGIPVDSVLQATTRLLTGTEANIRAYQKAT